MVTTAKMMQQFGGLAGGDYLREIWHGRLAGGSMDRTPGGEETDGGSEGEQDRLGNCHCDPRNCWSVFAVTGVMKVTRLKLSPILAILIPNLLVLTFGLAVISIARAVDKRPWA